jgi:hypothetical protein
VKRRRDDIAKLERLRTLIEQGIRSIERGDYVELDESEAYPKLGRRPSTRP